MFSVVSFSKFKIFKNIKKQKKSFAFLNDTHSIKDIIFIQQGLRRYIDYYKHFTKVCN